MKAATACFSFVLIKQKAVETQKQTNYNRIADAIEYLTTHYQSQPDLEEVAGHVALSPFHFQRLFTQWAGVSPKKFLQYLTVAHARQMLKNSATLFDTALETGLSGTGRLHDQFIHIEGMTPGEYKNGGENLCIHYSFAPSVFGPLLVASTPKGICHLGFAANETWALQELQAQFPNASYRQTRDSLQQNALRFFSRDWTRMPQVNLHLKGTEFQIKVWEALLKIPLGGLTTYGSIARQIQLPQASRAVGTAIGENPVAFLIPCHRVIQSTGLFGGYHWGTVRKKALIGWEAAQLNQSPASSL